MGGGTEGIGGGAETAGALLDVRELTVAFGGIVALDRVSFTISPGGICGLIGPNGAGKTTIFNVVSRIYQPRSGSVTFFSPDGAHDLLSAPPHRIATLGIARTFQNLALWPGLTVIENVMTGAHTRSAKGFAASALRFGSRAEERRLAATADRLLDDLGLARHAYHLAAGLPYGTLKRIELARALAAEPHLLMLDEPASGLNHGEVDELADLIRTIVRTRNLTVALVEHHMGLVMALCDGVVVLDFGRMIAQGPPDEIRRDPKVIEAYLGPSDATTDAGGGSG